VRLQGSRCLQTGFQRQHLGSLHFYRISSEKTGCFSQWQKTAAAFLTGFILWRCSDPAGAHQLQAFLCFVHVVLFLKVQVALELNECLRRDLKKPKRVD